MAMSELLQCGSVAPLGLIKLYRVSCTASATVLHLQLCLVLCAVSASADPTRGEPWPTIRPLHCHLG